MVPAPFDLASDSEPTLPGAEKWDEYFKGRKGRKDKPTSTALAKRVPLSWRVDVNGVQRCQRDHDVSDPANRIIINKDGIPRCRICRQEMSKAERAADNIVRDIANPEVRRILRELEAESKEERAAKTLAERKEREAEKEQLALDREVMHQAEMAKKRLGIQGVPPTQLWRDLVDQLAGIVTLVRVYRRDIDVLGRPLVLTYEQLERRTKELPEELVALLDALHEVTPRSPGATRSGS
jgi:hypothetical protein